MSAVLPHYRFGPANYQAATLIYGGQWVQPNTLTAGTTDLTIKLALSASVNVLGVAGADANVISTQTGAANAYGAPLIDISVLGDYDDLCPSWGPVDGCQCLAHLGHVPHPAELPLA